LRSRGSGCTLSLEVVACQNVLAVSDVHANWEALRRVPDECDAVIFVGDLVDHGPRPKECIG
jgi:hypothetical protein